MSKVDTFERVKEIGIIPAIRTSDRDAVLQAVEAIRLGGVPIIEVSLAASNALDVLRAVVSAHSHSVLVGAGTVVDAEGVRQAVLAGAQFIVTPGFSLEAVEKAKELGIAIFAGALTPTEVQLAYASGADAVKLYPCFATDGTRYLRALRGQFPGASFIASGGVDLHNCAEYIRTGAVAIGVGGEIADMDSLASRDFSVFTVRAKRLRRAISNARTVLVMGEREQFTD
jgi:2-dehydro-3-deoxyphosphogluconate aldolase / (4S)-4-hydroxy-2-oxoglutarate aldolase